MKKIKIPHSRPCLDESDQAYLSKLLQTHYISSGAKVLELGKLTAEVLGKKWAIPVQSGTDALVSALKAMKLREKQKVAIPAYICSAPLDAIAMMRLGAEPVDIDRLNLGIDPELVNDKKNISAVIAAHLFGIPAPVNLIDHRNVVEDCAQTLGVNVAGKPAGAHGRFAICSFYATKLVTSGHGGAIAGDEPGIHDELLDLFNHDKREKWRPHLHFLMSDFNAALGLSQLRKLGRFISERRNIAKRYSYAMTGKENIGNGAYSRFIVVSHKGADAAIRRFQAAGIEAKRPVYKPVFMLLGMSGKRFPNALWAHENIISVPLYPGMSENEINTVERFLEKNRNDLCCWPPA